MVLNLTNSYFEQNGYCNPNMSFLGALSPPSSSVDSSDTNTNSPHGSQFSPGQIIYNATEFTIMEESAISCQLMPYLQITEQPVDKFRFRYKSEMSGTHGTLTGLTSDKLRKCTHPTVQLNNYCGPAMIRCALYQIDNLDPHPHRLVCRDSIDSEKDDPHEVWISSDSDYTAVFHSMGIIHTAKKNLATELYNKLKKRKLDEIQRNGQRSLTKQQEAELKEQAIAETKGNSINLNTVRLGFEAFRMENNILIPICRPVFSHGINNLKSALTGELKIVRMDFITTSCAGGQEIFMLVEKVVKNNIKIRFFEYDEHDNEIWHAYGIFSHMDVHHQYAIVFRAPPYRRQDIEDCVQVFVELERPSDGAKSEPKIFKYKPCERLGKKRPRMNLSGSLSSGELPTTITNLSIEDSDLFDSTFLQKSNAINSEEFNRLFHEVLPDIETLYEPEPSNIDLNHLNRIDGPGFPSTSKSTVTNFDSETTQLAKKVVKQLGTLIKNKEPAENMENVIKRLFTDFRTAEGNNALHTSIICGQYDELQYMLVLLSKMKHLKLVDVKNGAGRTALHLAVGVANPTVVSLLVGLGARSHAPDNAGDTPLHAAVTNDVLHHCTQLITEDSVNCENYSGDTPLFITIRENKPSYMTLLLKHGANPNLKHGKTGNTALHESVREGRVEMVSQLVGKWGARLQEDNNQGCTPLSLATQLLQANRTEELVAICEILTKSSQDNGVEVKMEPVDDDSSDDEIRIKTEPNSEDEEESMEVQEINIKSELNVFPNELIQVLAEDLDNTETLKKLTTDLEFPTIISPPITTKMLLNFSNINQKFSVKEIMDLLEKYGETKCIEKINRYFQLHPT